MPWQDMTLKFLPMLREVKAIFDSFSMDNLVDATYKLGGKREGKWALRTSLVCEVLRRQYYQPTAAPHRIISSTGKVSPVAFAALERPPARPLRDP